MLKKCLTRSIFGEKYQPVNMSAKGWRPLRKLLELGGMELVRRVPFDPALRAEGVDHPTEAETMVGLRRLDNLEFCTTEVLRNGVPGDLVETGVWRGGSVIFMRAILKAYGDLERNVWAADSFEGLPQPDETKYPEDRGDLFWQAAHLRVSVDEVQQNFRRYGLLDEQVRFLEGWFRDTLPGAPIDRLAVLRLDGDMYESTIVALRALYPKVSVGGYVIVDDYGAVPTGAGKAVDDYRAEHGITEELVPVDWTGVYWQRV